MLDPYVSAMRAEDIIRKIGGAIFAESIYLQKLRVNNVNCTVMDEYEHLNYGSRFFCWSMEKVHKFSVLYYFNKFYVSRAVLIIMLRI